MSYPEVKRIYVFCGKRKSGKDYVTDILNGILGNSCVIVRLSGPLKKAYAVEHNLDYERLLGTSEYKERYRADMIVWGEEKRDKDHGYFCRLALADAIKPGIDTVIVSDARRQSDMDWLKTAFGGRMTSVRVFASEQVRIGRGWTFTNGVDDMPSECGLDRYKVDITITNEHTSEDETSKAIKEALSLDQGS
eukprot:Clim_evm49s152 gene=Clim_evmTU49s152